MNNQQINYEQTLVLFRTWDHLAVKKSLMISALILTVLMLVLFVNALFYGATFNGALRFLFGSLGIIGAHHAAAIFVIRFINR